MASYIGQIVDILLVTYVVYKLIMIIRGTRAVQLVKGIAAIFIVWFVSSFFRVKHIRVYYKANGYIWFACHYNHISA